MLIANTEEFFEGVDTRDKSDGEPYSRLRCLMRSALFFEDKSRYAISDEKNFYKLASEALLEEIIRTAALLRKGEKK